MRNQHVQDAIKKVVKKEEKKGRKKPSIPFFKGDMMRV